MKKIILVISFITSLLYSRTYEVPPTSSTKAGVPIISDKKMEECVKLYNQAKWLNEELNEMYVNQYESNSVNNYNNKIKEQKKITQKFNAECAGKQSYSAWKATQKLNKGQ